MLTTRLSLGAGLCLAAGLALADEPKPFTYAQFEASVPHFDVETCPAALAGEARFCRVTFHLDAVHVFAFSEENDQPMIGFRSFEDGEYDLSIK